VMDLWESYRMAWAESPILLSVAPADLLIVLGITMRLVWLGKTDSQPTRK
jgi:hypothetical protein